MRRWSRPVGLGVWVVVFAALVGAGVWAAREAPRERADVRNARAFIQDNLWSTEDAQFAVWVDPAGTPYVGRRRRGGGDWKVAPLDRVRGNPLGAPTADDEHNVYVVAAYGGRVHVAGNMHASALRYVSGAGPSLTRWTTAGAPGAGDQVTYPSFTRRPGGGLLFWHRDGVSGDARVVIDELRPGRTAWRRLATVLDGRPSGEGPYLHHIASDPRSGTLHILFEWRATPDVATTNDVGYARSVDGGHTWQTSGGRRLRLPITHAAAERVVDTRRRNSGLLNGGGLTVDAQGRPHAVVTFLERGARQRVEHLWLDRGRWHRRPLEDVAVTGRPQLAGTPDGHVWLLGVRRGRVVAIDVTPGRPPGTAREIARVPLGWEVVYDSEALARHGRVELLIPRGKRPHVVVPKLSP